VAARESLLVNGSSEAPITLVIAHGAGAPMDSHFMNTVAEAIGGTDVRVVRFEFPYMAARHTSGKRHAPDREPVLIESWRSVIAKLGSVAGLVIGGKSLGGRIASMIADEVGAPWCALATRFTRLSSTSPTREAPLARSA
jgi:predicted alpha/beta-hydrolase family hydrolase